MTSGKPEPDLESSIWIARSPEDIWNYLLDVANDTQWRTNVTAAQWTSDPPYGIGSTGLHIVAGVGDWPWRIMEWEEARIASWDVTGGRFEGGRAGYRIAPEGSGSRMTLHIRMKRSMLMRIITVLMKGRLRRELAADLEKLKAIMEA